MVVVEALEKNEGDFVIDRTSIKRFRQILGKESASYIKDKFQESDLDTVVLYWDGKLLPNLVGKDIIDRLFIVFPSGTTEDILNIFVLQNAIANEKETKKKKTRKKLFTKL
jgi:hypothetical protein